MSEEKKKKDNILKKDTKEYNPTNSLETKEYKHKEKSLEDEKEDNVEKSHKVNDMILKNLDKNEVMKKLENKEIESNKYTNEINSSLESNSSFYILPVTQKDFPIINEKLKDCFCKIIKKKNIEVGFLCKIKNPYTKNYTPILITSYQVLDKKDIIEGKKIELKINNDKNKIILKIDDSRKIYINDESKFNITIVELKENEGFDLNKLPEIDENINKYGKDIDINEIDEEQNNIYLFSYSDKTKIIFNSIKKISKNNFEIEYSFNKNEKISIGSPIFKFSNNKLIGIHKDFNVKSNYNIGTILQEPINEFIKKKKNEIILELSR